MKGSITGLGAMLVLGLWLDVITLACSQPHWQELFRVPGWSRALRLEVTLRLIELCGSITESLMHERVS